MGGDVAEIPFTNSSLQLLCMPRDLKQTYYRMCPDPDAYRFGVVSMSSSVFEEMWVLAFGKEP